jgi:hypothetical protein
VLEGRRPGPEALLERRLKVVLEAPLESSAEVPLKVVLEAPLESSAEVPLKLEAWNQIEMEGPLERGAVASQD